MDGANVALRRFGREHLQKSLEWFNDSDLAALVGRSKRLTEEEHNAWFERLETNAKEMNLEYFAIVSKQEEPKHLGNIWLANLDSTHRKGEVRVLIGESNSQNKGFGTEAISLISRYAFETLNLHRVYSFVLEGNNRARKSFEKAGFKLEGTLIEDRFCDDRYLNVFLLGLVRKRA